MRLPRFASDARGLYQDVVERATPVVHEDVTGRLFPRHYCAPGDNSPICEKPTDSTNTQTLPIVLGAVIPITCAVVVLYFLHRRNKKRQRIEDAQDPHKSLDFGLDMTMPPPVHKKRFRKGPRPEMAVTDQHDPMGVGHKARGISMDMLGSPYLLPAGLVGSRESLHSMSRSVQDEHDPYRSVGMMRSSTDTARSPRFFNEAASIYSASTVQTGQHDRSVLLSNAQTLSSSTPRRSNSLTHIDTSKSDDNALRPMHSSTATQKTSISSPDPPILPMISESKVSLSPLPSPPAAELETVSFPLPPEPLPEPPVEAPAEQSQPPRTSSKGGLRVPRRNSASFGATLMGAQRRSDTSHYEEDVPPMPPPKIMESHPQPVTVPEYDYDYDFEPEEQGYDADPSMMYTGRFSIENSAPSHQYPIPNNRVSVMGLRPLPPDHPEENPEQRANRIRSFYKEYFDDSRPHPASAYYEEDWDADYYYDGVGVDPETRYYYPAPPAPFAQGMGRRAMTPPPRGAGGPRFTGEHGRHFSTMSAGYGPRGWSGQRAPPKKNLPPPKALTSLPTPHMLQNDSALMSPVDFAPRTSFREIQNGRRADSPLGMQRPFSPAVRAHSPLVSSYSTLSAIPSPHSLRKSGTFTSLDFAPVPRFQGPDGSASDSGSIRSARSGISAMQMDAVRQGAYRVSRIPKEFVTSKDDITNQLRPKMNLVAPA